MKRDHRNHAVVAASEVHVAVLAVEVGADRTDRGAEVRVVAVLGVAVLATD